MTFLFLVHRMAMGYGVSVVVAALAERIAARGHTVHIGCLEHDGAWPGLSIHIVLPNPTAVAALAGEVGATVVAAHASPFFETLPALPVPLVRLAWEHGDPTPGLFGADAPARAAIAAHKRAAVYGAVEGVIVISHFLRHDIGWPAALVIHNGCDHVADPGPKPDHFGGGERPLRVGTLMRLGQGEAFYKGGALFLELARAASGHGLAAVFAVMGRGGEDDAAPFRAAGLEVHLNADDQARRDFLRGLDVFVSPSLWEGFNLPVVEAQALGTVALAFDTGAHPEVTPFVAASPDDLLRLLEGYAGDRRLLAAHSAAAYHFVRSRFQWDRAAERFLALRWRRAATPPAANAWGRLLRGPRHGGWAVAGHRLLRLLWRRAWALAPARVQPLNRWLAERGALAAHSLREAGLAATLGRIGRRAWRWARRWVR